MFTDGRRYALSAMLGIKAKEDDDGNAVSAPRNVAPYKQPVKKDNDRIPLNSLLAERGLVNLTSCYRQFLQSEYGCSPEKMTSHQYEEQKAMLQKRTPQAEGFNARFAWVQIRLGSTDIGND